MNLFRTSTTTTADFLRKVGFYQEEALKSPILISKDGRPETVLMSYDAFLRLRERDRQAFLVADLPEDLAAAILAAEVPDVLDDGEA